MRKMMYGWIWAQSTGGFVNNCRSDLGLKASEFHYKLENFPKKVVKNRINLPEGIVLYIALDGF